MGHQLARAAIALRDFREVASARPRWNGHARSLQPHRRSPSGRREWAKIDYFQAYLRDVGSETSRLKKQGVPAEQAAKQVDMTKHKERLPIQGPGIPPIAARRIYELLDGAR